MRESFAHCLRKEYDMMMVDYNLLRKEQYLERKKVYEKGEYMDKVTVELTREQVEKAWKDLKNVKENIFLPGTIVWPRGSDKKYVVLADINRNIMRATYPNHDPYRNQVWTIGLADGLVYSWAPSSLLSIEQC